jgi:hypothetical protein
VEFTEHRAPPGIAVASVGEVEVAVHSEML